MRVQNSLPSNISDSQNAVSPEMNNAPAAIDADPVVKPENGSNAIKPQATKENMKST